MCTQNHAIGSIERYCTRGAGDALVQGDGATAGGQVQVRTACEAQAAVQRQCASIGQRHGGTAGHQLGDGQRTGVGEVDHTTAGHAQAAGLDGTRSAANARDGATRHNGQLRRRSAKACAKGHFAGGLNADVTHASGQLGDGHIASRHQREVAPGHVDIRQGNGTDLVHCQVTGTCHVNAQAVDLRGQRQVVPRRQGHHVGGNCAAQGNAACGSAQGHVAASHVQGVNHHQVTGTGRQR